MKRRSMAAATAVLLVLMLLSSCATSVTFNVVKPAEINMSDYTHLAVFDVEPYEFTLRDFAGTIIFDLLSGKVIDQPTGFSLLLDKEVASKFERSIIYNLQDSDYFSIIPPAQLRPFKSNKTGGAYSSEVLRNTFNVTASLIGTIEDMRFNEEVIEQEVEVDDGSGGTVTEIIEIFYQEVALEFSYSILDLRTNQIVASRYFRETNSRRTVIEAPDLFRAPKLIDLYTPLVERIASRIRYQLVPRTVREWRYFKKDTTENPLMESADIYVRDGLYTKALSIYLDVWYEDMNYAAGYNAAVLYEVMGQLRQAVSFMQEVALKTGNPEAFRKVDELKDRLDEYLEAMEQMRE